MFLPVQQCYGSGPPLCHRHQERVHMEGARYNQNLADEICGGRSKSTGQL